MNRRKQKRPSNPIAKELLINPLFRAKSTKTKACKEKRNDKWNRLAKFKPSKNDFSDGFLLVH